MYRNLLLPTDGSPAAEEGLRHGLGLARALGARVRFLYVLEPPGPPLLLGPENLPYYQDLLQDLRRAGEEALRRAEAGAQALGVPWESLLREGRPAEEILKEAQSVDLIVLGTHGRTGLDRLLLGSVAQEVVRRSPKPVLLVPHRAEKPTGQAPR